MEFGAQIVIEGETVSTELMGRLIELRVEEHLNKRATFAVRFDEDFRDGEPIVAGTPTLTEGSEIELFAPNATGEQRCLLVGQIEQTQLQATIGGVGSWFEIRGRDLRTRLDRRCEDFALEDNPKRLIEQRFTDVAGPGAEIAAEIDDGFIYEHEDPCQSYNYRGTALRLFAQLADENNFDFWLSYDLAPGLGPLRAKAKVNIRPSPPRGTELGVPVPDADVVPGDERELLVLPTSDKLENVFSFNANSDGERPQTVRASTFDQVTGRRETITVAEDEQPKTDAQGETAAQVGADGRDACIEPTGDAAYVRAQVNAALTEARYFVKASAETSVNMLGDLVRPHEIVLVRNVGCQYSGKMQITDVTHVINPVEHRMSFGLRSNTRGGRA